MSNQILDFNDPLVAHLDLTSGDETRFDAIATSLLAGMERYCKRRLVKGDYDEIYYDRTLELYLTAYPVDYVIRVFDEHQSAIKITGPTSSSYGISNNNLNLVDGTTRAVTTIDLDYANLSLSDLVDAINNESGWAASVAAKYASRLAVDLISSAGSTPNNLQVWDGFGSYQLDPKRGILEPNRKCGCNHTVRVIWNGGFDPLPDDLKFVVAELITTFFNDIGGFAGQPTRVSEKLDEYSYDLQFSNQFRSKLTPDLLSILSNYKDRYI
ncbi:MAG: hypothetical protein KGZ39_05705 [Simkania sp.]|nr:hypothetical protein [Simkania sp.]